MQENAVLASSKEVKQIVTGEISVYGCHQISKATKRSETSHDWNAVKCGNMCLERLNSDSYEQSNFHFNSEM